MATRASVRVGQTGFLRAQFTDDAGLPVQATSVTVDLFDPTLDPDVDTPTESGLTPVYLGEGVFELEITAEGPEGRWIDQWTGTIAGTSTVANLSFEVIAGGAIEAYPTFGLNPNNVVEVTLSKEIASTDGTLLGEDFTFSFTTTYTPLWSSVRKVRLEIGALIKNIPDDTINLALLEASLEAEEMNWKKELVNTTLYQHARREYVTCRASGTLLNNILGGGLLKSKMLADFQVQYDTQATRDLLGRVLDCADKWAGQLVAGGGANVSRNPRMVIKGDLDPDRPDSRRMMDETPGEPMANTAYRYPNTRRYLRTGVKPRGRLW